MLMSRSRATAAMTISRVRLSVCSAGYRCKGVHIAAALLVVLACTGAAAAPRPPAAHLEAVQSVAAPSAARYLCDLYSWACMGAATPVAVGKDALELSRAINRDVNAEVPEISDRRQYGREDVWTLPSVRGGDCEDFALAKKKRLIEAGVPAGAVLIATVLDRQRKPHAVLVLRARAGDFVLDNLTDRMLPWHRTGYSFLRMQNPTAPRKWDVIAAGGIFDGAGG